MGDVVQDAFLKAFLHLPSFREELFFELWFTRILVNACLDRLKAKTRRTRWLVPTAGRESWARDGPPSLEPSPEAALLARERRADLEDAIDRLSARQRTAVVLIHLEGRSAREVSVVMGLTESTVRVHVFRVMRRLRSLLDRDVSRRPFGTHCGKKCDTSPSVTVVSRVLSPPNAGTSHSPSRSPRTIVSSGPQSAERLATSAIGTARPPASGTRFITPSSLRSLTTSHSPSGENPVTNALPTSGSDTVSSRSRDRVNTSGEPSPQPVNAIVPPSGEIQGITGTPFGEGIENVVCPVGADSSRGKKNHVEKPVTRATMSEAATASGSA